MEPYTGTWQVGDVKITRLVELELGGIEFILPQASPETLLPIDWLSPHFISEEGTLLASIHALVVETPSHKVVVDTCIGNDKDRPLPAWTNLQLPFLQDLAAAGYPAGDIDTVLCTHLHVDHVGWNTMRVDGEWVPTFPNARYLLARAEYEYWDTTEPDAINVGVMDDSVRPVFAAGLVDLVETDHEVCDEIRLIPTHGHTPGHVSVEISSAGRRALITGDAFHHPCQMAHADWASSVDSDQAASTATRREMLAAYADTDVLVIGTHFATPTAGRIRSDGRTGYRFEVE
ncbi:MAG TPA: MBL fold metallo-hydrolase [Acidimicrobiales bacterium]|nr:MBL fold metallo-hydrolase [Acidimicrobiales bacterium]